jgi:hypothetical protein
VSLADGRTGGRRVDCVKGVTRIVGIRLHEARMLAVRDGDTEGQRLCRGVASLLKAVLLHDRSARFGLAQFRSGDPKLLTHLIRDAL